MTMRNYTYISFIFVDQELIPPIAAHLVVFVALLSA